MADMANGSRKSRVTTLVMLLVALLTAGAVGYAATRGGGDEPTDTSAAATTTTAETTTSAAATSTPETTSTSEAASTTAESDTRESTTTSATGTTTRSTTTRTSATTTTATTTTARTTDLTSKQPSGDARPTSGEVDLDGRSFPDSLSTRIGGCDTNGSFTYDLGGDYRSFAATVGTTDDTDSRSVVRFEVYTDDELAYTSGNLNQGDTADIDISVENAQTLRLGYLFIDGDLSRCSDAGEVVWGDPTLTE